MSCLAAFLRVLVRTAGLVWLAAVACAAPPNILVVITDDQGYGDFSHHGNPHVQTPVFDRFARDGVQFDRFYVNAVCAPTRASLLTGRWALRTGVYGVTQGQENLRLSEITLPQTLKAGGYRTGMFGKWHNGEQFPYTPPGRGFDEFIGFNNGHWNNYFDAEIVRGSQPHRTQGYMPDVLTDEAIAFMARNRAHPFFCYVSYNTPHSPYQVPDRYFAKFKAQGLDDVLASVYGMCENIDENFGRLLAALETHGLRDNTLVLFLTDNGANTDRYNAGMRGRKASMHEGGSRVPLLLQWPARFKQPRVVTQLAAHIDLYPTLVELAGVRPLAGPAIDGLSLVPLLEGRTASWPDRMLFLQGGGSADGPNQQRGAVRTARYRAVNEPAQPGKKKSGPTGWQLYDMLSDPGQQRNLADEKPEVLRTLATAYDAWIADVTRDGFARPAIPIGYAEHDPVTLYAPQAQFAGALRFRHVNGYSHDWIAGWTNTADAIAFDVDVVRPGTFAVEIAYACAPADAGARVRVRAGNKSNEAEVTPAPAPHIPLPHRNGTNNHYIIREWGTLRLGELQLARGQQRLVIEALAKPGTEVMEFKELKLTRVR